MSGRRKPTSTSAFGVGRRESHDASTFYARFNAPVLSDDDAVVPSPVTNKLVQGDSRKMDEIDDSSVALVITSPPYFAGKEYEEALGQGHVPASYLDYLQMLTDVFAECVRTLEPGGRIAVNVANLGRKPYRSLSADVIGILQDNLGLLLRGEVIWHKARGANGSCAWGSFLSPTNPVLRDLTERVVIASKGRFDRAVPRSRRQRLGLPAAGSISKDEFFEATTDVWEIPAESARRVGHPAPFPVELPLRLIDLYTFVDDLVLDPFMGSGTTAVAAVRSGRRFAGYDTESSYIEIAEQRIESERDRLLDAPAPSAPPAGASALQLARDLLEGCGFKDVRDDVSGGGVVRADLSAVDRRGKRWLFDVWGTITNGGNGLRRTDTLWKALGKAALIHAAQPDAPLVLLTTDAPTPRSPGERAWRSLAGGGSGGAGESALAVLTDLIDMGSEDDRARLTGYARRRVGRG